MLGRNNPKEPIPNPTISPIDKLLAPKYTLIDYSAIKGWLDYGNNRTMSGLKLANAADIKAVEMEQKYKNHGKDWSSMVMVFATMLVIGVVCFMLIMQFGSVSEVNEKLAVCTREKAQAEGTLNVCQGELEEFKPVAREITPEIEI